MTTSRWRFCANCGAELPGDAAFCPSCGQRLEVALAGRGDGRDFVSVGGRDLALAPVGKRFGAMLIDGLITGVATYAAVLLTVLVVALVELLLSDGERLTDEEFGRSIVVSSLIVSVALTVTFWLFDGFGWSPGKALTGIRTVRLDGRRPGAVHGFVRYTMRTVGFLAFGLGYLWALWDDRNQTWHDKLADTVVVRADALEREFEDRSADPLVTAPRMWSLSALGVLLLSGGVALNIWFSSSLDDGVAEPQSPHDTDVPRILEPAPRHVAEWIGGWRDIE